MSVALGSTQPLLTAALPPTAAARAATGLGESSGEEEERPRRRQMRVKAYRVFKKSRKGKVAALRRLAAAKGSKARE